MGFSRRPKRLRPAGRAQGGNFQRGADAILAAIWATQDDNNTSACLQTRRTRLVTKSPFGNTGVFRMGSIIITTGPNHVMQDACPGLARVLCQLTAYHA